MTLKVIVQGLGRGTALAKAVAESEQLELQAVIDPAQERLNDAKEKCRLDDSQLFKNFDDAVKNLSVDILVVATPTKFHCEHILEGLKKGVHVLCEKPLVTNINDLEKIKRQATRKGLRVATVQNMRFAPQFIKCRELLRQGTVGRLSAIELNYYRWRPPDGLEHALLYNHGVHHIDLIRSLTDSEPVLIDALEWDPPWTKDGSGSGRFLHMAALTKDGWSVIYNASYAETGIETPHTGIMRITGEKGTIVTSGEADKNPTVHLFRLERATGEHKNESIPVTPQSWSYFDSLILEGFSNAIEDNLPWETDIADNMKTLEWLFAAEKSIQSKK